MLMIGTTRLAQELYDVWRVQDMSAVSFDRTPRWELASTALPRHWPHWSELPARDKDAWKAVAERACNLLADAMGAR